MSCEYNIPGNPACKDCIIKIVIKRGTEGSHIKPADAVSKGLNVARKKGDSWVGTPDRDVVICDRGLMITVTE